jgi:hypothetical protein
MTDTLVDAPCGQRHLLPHCATLFVLGATLRPIVTCFIVYLDASTASGDTVLARMIAEAYTCEARNAAGLPSRTAIVFAIIR